MNSKENLSPESKSEPTQYLLKPTNPGRFVKHKLLSLLLWRTNLKQVFQLIIDI